ncbi:NAD(P)-binding protein [Pyrenochaeta sp. DS3sAY3a]|nr:NAD(P)-binding protein [Pyrenochaeta sp. DS3sAY3a]
MTSESIRKVALIGGSGNVGAKFLSHLLATGKHQVTVLTREDSTATFPFNVNLTVSKVDYTSETSIVDALRGNDFLIITMYARAPPTLHASIVHAAAKAGVRYVMPNYFAYGLGARGGALHADPILGQFGRWIDDVRDTEGVDYVALVCGFWYEFSLALGEQWLGFDIPGRKVTFYDEGTRKISTSTWEQCGRAVAGLLSLPETKESGTDTPALQDWRNEGLYISSFLLSQRDMLDSLNRVLGTSDADWTIKYEPVGQRYADGLAEMQAGDHKGFAKAMYARLFFASGEGDYETEGGLDNGKLGLPREDLDEATRRAVGMVEKGFGY